MVLLSGPRTQIYIPTKLYWLAFGPSPGWAWPSSAPACSEYLVSKILKGEMLKNSTKNFGRILMKLISVPFPFPPPPPLYPVILQIGCWEWSKRIKNWVVDIFIDFSYSIAEVLDIQNDIQVSKNEIRVSNFSSMSWFCKGFRVNSTSWASYFWINTTLPS